MRLEPFSGSAAAKRIVTSVMQAAENVQITAHSPELQLARAVKCYKKRCKTRTFEGAQHRDLLELD